MLVNVKRNEVYDACAIKIINFVLSYANAIVRRRNLAKVMTY